MHYVVTRMISTVSFIRPLRDKAGGKYMNETGVVRVNEIHSMGGKTKNYFWRVSVTSLTPDLNAIG